MEIEMKAKIVPEQHEGTQKDIDYAIIAADLNDAQKLFFLGRNRLLNVNHWAEYCGYASSTFMLTDSQGNEVDRTAEEGDYFKIKIPAPSNSTGNGYDWVYIEAIEDNSDVEGPFENIAMRVRPSKNPQVKGENIAHFFSYEATSSFVVSRFRNKVSASVYGRNEKPNTSTTDIVRNTLVALTAMLGLSNVQWEKLVRGLIVIN